jgi:pimeloyl-ACP methyl ester carboxylesterase
MQVDYVTTCDGVRIAVTRHGHGPPLLFVRGWISHIELMWAEAAFRVYWEALGEHFTVTRFDMRGNGLSQRDIPPIDLAAMVADIEAVMDDGGGIDRAIVYAQCFGGPAAIAYSAAHPERVERLILDGTYAEGHRLARPERQRQILGTLRDLPEAGLAFLTHLTHPNPGPSRFRTHAARMSAIDFDTALEVYALSFALEVSDLLPRLTMPVLVMHRENTRAVPFRLGRDLATSIRGARFVPLEGQAHNSWEEFPEIAIAALSEFLGVPLHLESLEEVPERFLAILVVEIGGAVRGDVRTTAEDAAHQAIPAHNGAEITHGGEDIMAYFPAARDAVECAIALQQELATRAPGVVARIGVHAGEPVGSGGDTPDAVAEIARHAAAACRGSEIMVSAVLRDHCAGHGFLFAERDTVAGVADESVRLYEVRWRSDA